MDNLPTNADLLTEVRQLIESAKTQVVAAVNAEMTLLYWRIGQRINTEMLGGERAEYGERLILNLSQQLSQEYGRGFTEKNLRRMMQFAQAFPDEQIVVSLIRQLSWTHILALLPLKQPLQREFYAEMCRVERWSVRTLRQRINSMLYERTALSRKPDELIAQELATLRDAEKVSPDLLLRDPYMLDFLGLQDTFLESDLEHA
ncbi:MAG: DUF1016 domain-containing protein, partial [Candidatus Omnitrophica bacterium]|nr:DUF1016 domain-containing protein [Candidatus Omnitrophota bacterium]